MAPFFLAAAALCLPAAGAGGADVDPAAITDLYAHSLEAVRECERRSPGNSKSLYDTGLVHRRFGYDDRAIEAFRECLKKDPAHPEVHNELGFLLSQRFQDQAIAEYRAALALKPGLAGTRTRIGMILAHQGHHGEALAELDAEIKNGSADALTHLLRGQALLDLRRAAEAVPALEESLRLDSGDRKTWYALSQAHLSLGHREESAKARKEFVRLKAQEDASTSQIGQRPTNRQDGLRSTAETYADVAETYRQLKLLPESLLALRRSVRFDPANPAIRKRLVEMLLSEKRFDEALVSCQEGVALVRSPDLLYLLAGLHTEKGNFQEAAKILNELLGIAPNDGDTLRELAKLHLGGKIGGSPQDGLALAQRAVQNAPRNDMNRFVLAMAFLSVKDVPGAIRELEAAIEINPRNPSYQRRLSELKGGAR